MNVRKRWIPKLGGWIFSSTVALGSVLPIVSPGVAGGEDTCTGAYEVTCLDTRGQACFVPGDMPHACQAEFTTGPTGHSIPGAHWACPAGCVTPLGQPGGTGCSVNDNCYY